MTVQKRLMVVAGLFALSLAFYGAAKHYSPALVLYVVEQSLAQKAPPGTDSALLHRRLHALLAATPEKSAQMKKLLEISGYLEKVQQLTSGELDRILEKPRQPGTLPVSHFQ